MFYGDKNGYRWCDDYNDTWQKNATQKMKKDESCCNCSISELMYCHHNFISTTPIAALCVFVRTGGREKPKRCNVDDDDMTSKKLTHPLLINERVGKDIQTFKWSHSPYDMSSVYLWSPCSFDSPLLWGYWNKYILYTVVINITIKNIYT